LVLSDGKGDAEEVLGSFLSVFERVGAQGHLRAQFEHLDILVKSLDLSERAAAKAIKKKISLIRSGYEKFEN
jgi:hypothetical protein